MGTHEGGHEALSSKVTVTLGAGLVLYVHALSKLTVVPSGD